MKARAGAAGDAVMLLAGPWATDTAGASFVARPGVHRARPTCKPTAVLPPTRRADVPGHHPGLPLQPKLEVEDVGEFDFESVRSFAVVAEVHLAEGFGGELEQLVLVHSGGLRVEQPGGVAG